VYESNLRVRISRTAHYAYPDASVICGTRGRPWRSFGGAVRRPSRHS